MPGLRHNGHASYGTENFLKPAMGNLIEDLCVVQIYINSACCWSFNVKRIDKLNKDRINRAKKFINSIKFKDDLIFHSNFNNKSCLSFIGCILLQLS